MQISYLLGSDLATLGAPTAQVEAMTDSKSGTSTAEVSVSAKATPLEMLVASGFKEEEAKVRSESTGVERARERNSYLS